MSAPLLFRLSSLEKAYVIRANFPKKCNVCRKSYTFKQWQRLPNPRSWSFDWGEIQEIRECSCGTTLAIIVVEGAPEK